MPSLPCLCPTSGQRSLHCGASGHRRVSCRANKPPPGAFPRGKSRHSNTTGFSWLFVYSVFIFIIHLWRVCSLAYPERRALQQLSVWFAGLGLSCCFVLFPLLHGHCCSSMSGWKPRMRGLVALTADPGQSQTRFGMRCRVRKRVFPLNPPHSTSPHETTSLRFWITRGDASGHRA